MSLPVSHRPRPVLTPAGIAGLIASIVFVLGFLGYNDAARQLSAMTTSITAVVIGLVPLFLHLFAGLHAQSKVTPLSDPRNNEGVPLVPVTKIGGALADYAATVNTQHTAPAPAPAPAVDVPDVSDDAIAAANAAAGIQ